MGFEVKGSYEKERVNGMADVLEELKQIDLVNFVERYGYRMDTRKSSKAAGADKVMRREGDDDKLLIRECPAGWEWCSCRDWSLRGSIVDFVMVQDGIGFVQALSLIHISEPTRPY